MNKAIIKQKFPTIDEVYRYKTLILSISQPLDVQLNESNIKYIIKYNFDLNGNTIEIPSNCIIAIDGGSISNGTLVGNNSILLNVNKVDNILFNVSKEGTWLDVDQLNSISIGTVTSGNIPEVTITKDGTNSILNFVLPKGKGILNISKTNTSGLVDTYTITYDDGSTSTFTVTNGRDGEESTQELKTINEETLIGVGNIYTYTPKVIQTYSSATIEPNTLNIWNSVPSTITLGNPIEGYVNEYMIRFSTDDISPSITFPTFKNSDEEIINIKWSETLSLEPNATYEISIIDEYGAITKFV